MKATHKVLGQVEVIAKSDAGLIYVLDSNGNEKSLMALFANLTDENGSKVDDFSSVPNRTQTSIAAAPKKESKLASMMANAHQDEKYNSMTKTWEKIE